MAKPEKKPKYTGPRSLLDTAGEREVVAKRLANAYKNSNARRSNAIVALEDQEFKDACEKAGVKPTARQASKFRQPAPYGLAARAAGKNTRRNPEA